MVQLSDGSHLVAEELDLPLVPGPFRSENLDRHAHAGHRVEALPDDAHPPFPDGALQNKGPEGNRGVGLGSGHRCGSKRFYPAEESEEPVGPGAQLSPAGRVPMRRSRWSGIRSAMTATFSSSRARATSERKTAFLRVDSLRMKSLSGNTEARGIPG